MKPNVLFYTTLVIFLILTFVMVEYSNFKRANDYQKYLVILSNVVTRDNDKMKYLYGQLVAQHNALMMLQKENEGLRDALTETRNGLDALSKKFAQPLAMAPEGVPASSTK